jgi:hypothetical protein
MAKYHKDNFIGKCKAEGVSVKLSGYDNSDTSNTKITLDGPQPIFTREGLLERLVRWIAVDDQASTCTLNNFHSNNL